VFLCLQNLSSQIFYPSRRDSIPTNPLFKISIYFLTILTSFLLTQNLFPPKSLFILCFLSCPPLRLLLSTSKSIPDKNLSLDRQSLEQQTFRQINVYLSIGLRVIVEGRDLGQQYIRYADYIHAKKFSFNLCAHEFYERINSNKNSFFKPLSSEGR
jgi:hypothetical protein